MPRSRRGKAANNARPTAHEAFIDDRADDGDHDLPLSDEEETTRTKETPKIIAHDGQLGFSKSKKGFDPRTNFTMEVHGDIYSTEYQLKGINIIGNLHHDVTHIMQGVSLM